MNILDRMIGWVSPTWAAERQMARAAMETFTDFTPSPSAYRNSDFRALDAEPTASPGAAPDTFTELTGARRKLVDRARKIERYSPIGETLLHCSVQNVVGCGFKLEMQTEDEKWNEAIEAAWEKWSRKSDVRAMGDFNHLLRITLRSHLRDGDVGLVLQDDDNTIRIVESDEIANPEGGTFFNENRSDGIVLDDDGRAVSYHVVRKARMLGDRRARSGDGIDIPAEQMIFLPRTQRAGQTRGITAFATVAHIIDQIEGNIEAITAATRMAACFGLVIKRHGRAGNLPTIAGSNTRRRWNMRPGSVFELFPDEEVDQVKPEHPHKDFSGFIKMLIRLVSLPFGLPLEVALHDYSETNYSSARASLLQAWSNWRCLQDMLKFQVCDRVFEWQFDNLVAMAGRSRGPGPREQWMKHEWRVPGWQWVDPQKEITAFMAAVDAGFDSRTNIAAKMGRDWEEIMRSLEREKKMAEEMGIDLSRSSVTRDEMPEPAPGQEPPGQGGAAKAKPAKPAKK